MNWTQVIDPFKNIAISALVAVIPIIFIFWALIIRKMKGYQASLLAVVIALLIAFSFGSFLEGMACFGAPVAITAAMLVGLGFNPLYAAGICLIANTAPVAFGSIGIPITVASQVSGIPEMAISQMVGRTLPFLSFLIPFYLTVILCGFRKAMQVWPAVLVSGASFALLQWFSSNFLSPMLPDVLAGIGSIICLMIFLRFWKPKNIWRF